MNVAEYNVIPDAVLIHNPVLCGSLSVFQEVEDLEYLQFRERPNEELFQTQHESHH